MFYNVNKIKYIKNNSMFKIKTKKYRYKMKNQTLFVK